MTDECIKLHLYPLPQLSVRLIKVLSTWYEMLRVDFYFYQIIPTVIKKYLDHGSVSDFNPHLDNQLRFPRSKVRLYTTGIGVLTGQSQYFVTS